MNEEWSQVAANTVANAAYSGRIVPYDPEVVVEEMVQASRQEAAASHQRPSAVFRPRLSVDGDRWIEELERIQE